MPALSDYARLAPFSLEELVGAANSILRDRPRLAVTPRTVRYYISVGLLPPPAGPPKYSRYSQDHLQRLVGARCLQDEGWSLKDLPTELDRLVTLDPNRLESRLLSRERPVAPAQPAAGPAVCFSVAEPSREVEPRPRVPRAVEPEESERVVVRRLRLTPDVVLEVRDSDHFRESLEEASSALCRLIASDPDR